MVRISLAGLALLAVFNSVAVAQADKPTIDIVFCIDCSGSMGGVIETAKQKVWAIINETAKARPQPVLRIGLIGYGNAEGPFRVFPLSDDLDEVYKNLMTFKDEGWGAEFVGLAVHNAIGDMKWSDARHAFRVMYVVGNETARQGPDEFDYCKTVPQALAKHIVVNAIYCGDTDYAQATPTWKELAKLADGDYMEIAAEGGAIALATPFDDRLAALNTRLNETYLPYGVRGAAGGANQLAQDANALGLSSTVLADRALAKSSHAYRNAAWDLVDASLEDDFDLSKIDPKELPEALQKLTPEQRLACIKEKAKEREAVQTEIQAVAGERGEFIKAEIIKQGLSTERAFDEAVKHSLRKQAEKNGFEFTD